jgi:ATP-dependent DNA helicase RecQ
MTIEQNSIAFVDTEVEPKTGKIIDILFLSPLLFPTKPYHRLLKDDKLQTDSKLTATV